MEKVDFLIIGGGIIGLNLALEARRRQPKASIMLLEKESVTGSHASGRNSGVLHAGFYYTADSLKARFSVEGNRLLTDYCLERGLSLNRCGKLVVAKDIADLPGLKELLRRGRANGVPLEEISAEDAREIEPRVRTFERALFSPTTATVSPSEVLASLSQDAIEKKVEVRLNTAYLGRKGEAVITSAGVVVPGYLINAAGLYADKIAKDFAFSKEHEILPFKGLYLKSDEPKGSLKTHIYPVPDLENPFLGVHYTLTASGEVKIGPTAIPAFWREHYGGLSGFNLKELVDIGSRELGLLIRNDFGFRSLAFRELAKYSRKKMVGQARELAAPAARKARWHWGEPGIRAQLIHLPSRRLEMDFYHEGDEKSFHLLNVVSPGFTCSMAFCRYVFDEIENKF
ncbi:MAG: FAD-dependent oxidoreductase [Magnetococcales bacterium]|nr:FAD-dependent oxidoreductase [Magnetococcales bacterium]